jgi:hypothetical protein
MLLVALFHIFEAFQDASDGIGQWGTGSGAATPRIIILQRGLHGRFVGRG